MKNTKIILTDVHQKKKTFPHGDELYTLPEFWELQKICSQNWRIILKNWDVLTTENEQDTKFILSRAFLCAPSYNVPEKVMMAPEEYIEFLNEALPFFKKKNEQDIYIQMAQNGRFLSYNFTMLEVKKILVDIIDTCNGWKKKVECVGFQNVLNGSDFFTILALYDRQNPDGTKRIPFNKWTIGKEFTPLLMHTLAAYASAYQEYEYYKMNPKKLTTDLLIRPSNEKLEKQSNILLYYKALQETINDEDFYKKRGSFLKKYISGNTFTLSYSAEWELLKWLENKEFSLEIRLMVVNVLWRGLYAMDQVERFLPMLKASEKEIREMSFNTMPCWLKDGIKYDASKMPTEKEYAAISETVQENIKKNPDKLIVFEQEK